MNEIALNTIIPLSDSFSQALSPEFQKLAVEHAKGELSNEEILPYLEPQDISRTKFAYEIEKIEAILYKCGGCGRSWMQGNGEDTGLFAYRRLTCKESFCDDCGAKDGRVHNRRMAKIKEVWGELTDESACVHWVFTVPKKDRIRFFSPEGARELQSRAQRLIKKVYGKRGAVQAFQPSGDRFGDLYIPHVHVLLKFKYGETLKIFPEQLLKVKKKWGKTLRDYGCTYDGLPVVHYNYGRGVGEVYNKTRYIALPRPGPDIKQFIYTDPVFCNFILVEMRKFKYLRLYGWGKREKKSVDDGVEVLRGNHKLMGEFIKWDYTRIVSTEFVDALLATGEYVRDNEDFQRQTRKTQ